jgi:hypothetical protein
LVPSTGLRGSAGGAHRTGAIMPPRRPPPPPFEPRLRRVWGGVAGEGGGACGRPSAPFRANSDVLARGHLSQAIPPRRHVLVPAWLVLRRPNGSQHPSPRLEGCNGGGVGAWACHDGTRMVCNSNQTWQSSRGDQGASNAGLAAVVRAFTTVYGRLNGQNPVIPTVGYCTAVSDIIGYYI